MTIEDNDLAADLLRGIPRIAKFLGTTERQAYYLAEKKLIPAFKRGKIWEARRSTLRRHTEQLEAGHV
jgi:hypothetical protein